MFIKRRPKSTIPEKPLLFAAISLLLMHPSVCEAVDPGAAFALFESPFPDARLEISYERDAPSLVLAWPIAVEVYHGGCSKKDAFSPFVDASVEYQLQTGNWASRGVGALRTGILYNEYNGLFVEGGGVVGTDGDGWMTGGGYILTNICIRREFVGGISLGYRHYFLGHEQRGEFALDFRFPLNFLFP